MWGGVVKVTPRPLYIRETYQLPAVQEAGWTSGPVWTCAENVTHRRDSIPQTVQPSGESQYRLKYRNPRFNTVELYNN